MHSIPKRRAWQQLHPLTRRALEAQGPGPFGPSRAACALLVDTIATRISVASRTTAGSSWWFSASSRRLQADLERVAPKTPTSSPIVMVASTPAHRDHLALIESACTPAATGCTAAAQRGEQKRSTVQWRTRSALSTALSSAIVRAMTAGGANAGAEGALTAIPPSFLARNGDSKYRLFTVP